MHIALLSTFGGGLRTYCNALSKGLADRGHHVTVLYPPDYRYSIEQDTQHIRYLYLPGRHWSITYILYYLERIFPFVCPVTYYIDRVLASITIYRFLDRIHQKHRIDLFEAYEAFYVPSLISCKYPIVVRLHGSAFIYKIMCKERLDTIDYIKAKYDNILLTRCTSITSPSKANARTVAREHDVNLQDITVIPNPLDTACYASFTNRARKENIILFPGRIEVRKGAHWFLEALAEIDLRNNHYKVIFAGKLSKDDQMLPWLNNSKIASDINEGLITFLGEIPRRDLLRIYQKARIVVIPSVWEVFGYTAIEAMAFGAVVVAHDSGGLSEIVRHNENGFLFSSVDELVSVLRRCMANLYDSSIPFNGLESVKKYFSSDMLLPKFIAHYENVIKGQY